MFTVYSKPACPACEQAKDLLKSKKLAYTEIILDVGQEKIESTKYITRDEFFSTLPGARSVPQIIAHSQSSSRVIGGLNELRQHLST